MKKRQIPEPINAEEFKYALKKFENYVGLDWLRTQPADASPLTQVWNRTDYIASLELFTIAESYQRLASPSNAGWLAEYRKAIRTHNTKDILSQTYELVSAAMFSQEYDVQLCAPAFPGYDFTVCESGKTIRVSCKKLLLSDSERSFYKQSLQLYEHLREVATKLRINSLKVVMYLADPANRLTLSELQTETAQGLAVYKDRRVVIQSQIGGWLIQISPVDSCPDEFSVDHERVSIHFLCLVPFLQDEQKRFVDRFNLAARKLKKYGRPVDTDNVNVIMIGLSPAISIAKAKEWLEDKFSRDNSSITGVLLNRAIPVTMPGMPGLRIQHESALILNPNARIKWHEFAPDRFSLNAKLPIGGNTETESYLAFIINDEVRLKLDDVYMFQRGQIYCRAEPGKINFEFGVPRASGIQYRFILQPLVNQGAMLMDTIVPPEDALVLL
jgi:hypothetical protein